jgi:hypothetical protein
MTDSEDFPAYPTARDKYDMDDEAYSGPICIIDGKITIRHPDVVPPKRKEPPYFFRYKCLPHGAEFLVAAEQYFDGPEQFEIFCSKCEWRRGNLFASFSQVESMARFFPHMTIQEMSGQRSNFIKMFGPK